MISAQSLGIKSFRLRGWVTNNRVGRLVIEIEHILNVSRLFKSQKNPQIEFLVFIAHQVAEKQIGYDAFLYILFQTTLHRKTSFPEVETKLRTN